MTVAGPNAWRLLQAAGFDDALAPASMKHMTMREIDYAGTTLRVMRASFSGELGYEINVPALYTQSLMERLWQAGDASGLGVGPYGIEALMLMRIEKGFIHVGADTDGTTLPHDIGMAGALAKKTANFVGRRSLLRAAGTATESHAAGGPAPGGSSHSLAGGCAHRAVQAARAHPTGT